MDASTLVPMLLGGAVLLPLLSFAVIVLVGPNLGEHGKAAGTVATAAILGSAVLSFISLFLWLGPNWPVPAHHGDHHAASHGDKHGTHGHDDGAHDDHGHDDDHADEHGNADHGSINFQVNDSTPDAEALAAIAHPDEREELHRAAREIDRLGVL